MSAVAIPLRRYKTIMAQLQRMGAVNLHHAVSVVDVPGSSSGYYATLVAWGIVVENAGQCYLAANCHTKFFMFIAWRFALLTLMVVGVIALCALIKHR